jgi:hypothetical protein
LAKSRLVAEFHDHIRDAAHIWMESAGEQFFENTPFHAIIEMLSRWVELRHAARSEERFEKVEPGACFRGSQGGRNCNTDYGPAAIADG